MKHAVYGSLGEPIALPAIVNSPALTNIGYRHGRTPEEVAIKWNLQSGVGVNLRLNSNYGVRPRGTQTAARADAPVSYTHLTLPTICSV